MESHFLVHISSFIGVLILVCLMYRSVLKYLSSGREKIKHSKEEAEKKLNEIMEKIVKCEDELEKIKLESTERLVYTKNTTNEFIKSEEEKMQHYYEERKKEIDKLIRSIKKERIAKVQKAVIEEAVSKLERKHSSSDEGHFSKDTTPHESRKLH